MDFMIGLTLGILGAGALMYYIQPSVKVFVAKAFSTEASLAADYAALAAKLSASAAAKAPAPTAVPPVSPAPPAAK
jgi:hypothetical protein